MNPLEVFRLVKQMGGIPPSTLIVGCEPAFLGEEGEGAMGLSAPVAASVGPAVQMVHSLLQISGPAGGERMMWWLVVLALIVIVLVVGLLGSMSDIRRYLRIRRM